MDKESTHPTSTRSSSNITTGFLWLCLIVAIIWIACSLLIYFVFPDWQTRGAVGNVLGAANALFSGLAFAGVIYALNLQREELKTQREEMLASRKLAEAQLDEMITSRKLISQPLAIPEINQIQIEKPRFFYTPPEDEHSANSRYNIRVNLTNPTPYPAIGVNARCFLQCGEPAIIFHSTDTFISIIPPESTINNEETAPNFLFAGDSNANLIDFLRQTDWRKGPFIIVIVLFKNATGAHFRLTQAFQPFASAQQIEILRRWHTEIVGFQVKYKQELANLTELKRKDKDDKWSRLFEHVKKEFYESVSGEDEINIYARAISNTFTLEHISEKEFEEEMSLSRYAQTVHTLLHICMHSPDYEG